ncbi:MAG: NAD(P)H-quinone oxidoreductase, partial [Myxococcota bacterium]|nr:NAD(P)H-quinone oxidoreductase [Myxococcota bacterium]
GPRDILVRVAASALNRADLLQCRGLYPAPAGSPKDIPGLEYAGEVVATGGEVTRWSLGDRVMGVVGGGAAAELVAVHEDEAVPTPKELSLTDAAAIPEAFMTAFDAAILQGGLAPGGWVAVNAVASGVGTALVQIARRLGARTVGSSRTPAKLDAVRSLGLDVPVVGASAELGAAANEATENRGVDLVVDLVGGEALPSLVHALGPRGTLMLVGLLGGPRADLPLARVLMRRLRVQGTVLRSRDHEEKQMLARAFEAQLLPGFQGEQPTLQPVVDRVLPWALVAEGHRALAANATSGKVVLDHHS